MTTASEEVLSIERCHVCGRTPTSGEKLAPCRSCAELTCRDCFDRMAHVCQKCSADGKVVAAPLSTHSRAPQSRSGGEAAYAEAPVKAAGGRSKLILVAGGLVVLALLAGFYLVDPLKIFHAATPDGTQAPDTIAIVVPDSLLPDSAGTDSTALIDTTSTYTAGSFSGLPLPAGVDSSGSAPPASVEITGAPYGAEVLPDAVTDLLPGLGSIAASVPILIDRFSVLRVTESGTIVVAVSVLHPEEDTKRYDLLRKLGAWLGPGPVDEIAFYYAESQYHPVRAVSFTHENFAGLSASVGPLDFQECASTSSDQVWAFLSGPVQIWMARFAD